jgi:hypothetical protein
VALVTSPLESLRGARHPRVRLAPAAAYSHGPEAAELARRAGFPLDEWQFDGVCDMLSVRPDGLWACFEYCEICSRQNGKTVGIFLPRALAGMFLLRERLVTWSAHEYKTAMEGFRAYKGALLNLGKEVKQNIVKVRSADGDILVKVSNTNGEESFERLDTGQRVKFIARSKGSGRGFGATNLIDEAFAYTREQQDAIMPTILAQPNPQIGYASSPPLTGDTGEVLHALRKRAEGGSADALGWRDWGLAGYLDELTALDEDERRHFLDDRSRWASANPALGGRLSVEKIQRLRESMSGEGFAREVLGVWPRPAGDGAGIFDPELWSQLADPGSQLVDPVVFAAAATPERGYGSIGVAGARGDRLLHGEVVENRSGVNWMLPRLIALNESHKPRAIIIDPASAAGSLIPGLQEAGIEPELLTGRERAAACGALYDAVVEDGRFRHLNQPQLNAAVAGAKRKDMSDAWVFDRKTPGVDISPLDAVSLAVFGHLKHAGDDEGAPNLWI